MYRATLWSLLLTTFALGWADIAGAQDDADPTAAEQAIDLTKPYDEVSAAITSYVKAFNDQDAAALAAHWSPEAIYVSRSTGEQVVGREAIAAQFELLFADDVDRQLTVSTESIEFVSPNVAIERGGATVVRGDADVVETSYRAVFVNRDGQWLIDRISEEETPVVASNYEKLKDLEWMIGDWTDQGEDFSIETSCNWTRNQNYIARTFKVIAPTGVGSSGLQVIGWDAKNEQIRSWLFDSSGGFVSGIWRKSDDSWTVQSIATLADGGSGSFTSVFRRIDDNTYSWRKVNRVVDGQLQPNLDAVTVVRR